MVGFNRRCWWTRKGKEGTRARRTGDEKMIRTGKEGRKEAKEGGRRDRIIIIIIRREEKRCIG